jgi:hypothetical protein
LTKGNTNNKNRKDKIIKSIAISQTIPDFEINKAAILTSEITKKLAPKIICAIVGRNAAGFFPITINVFFKRCIVS